MPAARAPLAFARHQELMLDNDAAGDFHLQGNNALLGALLRNLVEQHGGRLLLENLQPTGLMVSVTLPRQRT